MRGSLRLFVVVGLAAVCCAAADWAHAQGPKGRGGGFHRGGGHGRSYNNGPQREGWQWNNDTFQWERSGQPDFSKWSRSSLDPSASDHPWSQQRAIEERKLAHRKQVADHLRDVSERNGNENLKDVADRMEQKAQEHYDKRLATIDQQRTLDNPLDDARGNLTGRENALDQQLRNEERQFAQRMQAADQLRQLAESTGDAQILDAANRLEETAFSHYEQRLSQIGQFQQRFDLPQAGDFLPSLPFGLR